MMAMVTILEALLRTLAQPHLVILLVEEYMVAQILTGTVGQIQGMHFQIIQHSTSTRTEMDTVTIRMAPMPTIALRHTEILQ